MGKAYVTHGMKARCTSGTMSNYLNTQNGHGVVYKGQPLLNANDHIPGVNFSGFGNCANLQGMKCVPATPLAWQFCNTKHLLDGAPALTTDSKCMCLLGGVISIEPEGGAGAGSAGGGAGSSPAEGGADGGSAEGARAGEGADGGSAKGARARGGGADGAQARADAGGTQPGGGTGSAAGAGERQSTPETAAEDAQEDDRIAVWEFFLPFVVVRKKKVKNVKDLKKKEEQKKPDEALYRYTEEKVGQITSTKAEFAPTVKKFKEVFQRQKKRYKKIGDACGAPPELIAVLHYRENTSDYLKETFDVYLHNGQRLGKKTTIHPAGKLFDDFDKAAEDALSTRQWLLKKYHLTAESKDMVAMMCFAESYNGLGYYNRKKISPYLYSGTNLYVSGKYTSDGHYDENAVDKQTGVYLLLHSVLGPGAREADQKPEAKAGKQESGMIQGKKKMIKRGQWGKNRKK